MEPVQCGFKGDFMLWVAAIIFEPQPVVVGQWLGLFPKNESGMFKDPLKWLPVDAG